MENSNPYERPKSAMSYASSQKGFTGVQMDAVSWPFCMHDCKPCSKYSTGMAFEGHADDLKAVCCVALTANKVRRCCQCHLLCGTCHLWITLKLQGLKGSMYVCRVHMPNAQASAQHQVLPAVFIHFPFPAVARPSYGPTSGPEDILKSSWLHHCSFRLTFLFTTVARPAYGQITDSGGVLWSSDCDGIQCQEGKGRLHRAQQENDERV